MTLRLPVLCRAQTVGSLLTLLVLSGCGSSPAAPSSPASTLPLRTGTYVVTFVGYEAVGIGSGPIVPGCPGIPAGLHQVSTEIDLMFASGAWHGRPRLASGGSFEVTFSPGPLGAAAPGGGPGVTATATGTVISTRAAAPTAPVPDSRVLFGLGATLTGGLSGDGRVGSGFVSGELTFANSAGASTGCHSGTVSWTLSAIG